ncbi:MAG: DUF1801 domain-containing protein [Ferruginibacter sp.]
MKYDVGSIKEYIAALPEERRPAVEKLRAVIKKNLPKGFEEDFLYNMIGFVVPHMLYPAGYHCKPETPLPFINIASQKNFIALYHMGLYAMPEQYKWFVDEYAKRVPGKLDMGKSCIRFKKPDQIPFGLIGELCKRITVTDWINKYESVLKKK